MGEVYRARDERLRREVALKVLPASIAQDTDRLRRFESEARAASALNHPNIVTVHEIGKSNGTTYMAMELVDGRACGRCSPAARSARRRCSRSPCRSPTASRRRTPRASCTAT
jgi:serine/threonine protein kinase